MSEDKNSSDNSHNEIDLDDLEVDVLILAQTPVALASSSAFLMRRGWPTTVISGLTRAIEHIAAKNPDFVLISLNHLSPSMAGLPELIEKSFHVTCIAFAETLDASAGMKLTQSKLKNKITGQASGPNIYRVIRKILEERLNTESSERSNKKPAPSSANSREVLSTGKYILSKGARRSFKELTRAKLDEQQKQALVLQQAELLNMVRSAVVDAGHVESKEQSEQTTDLKQKILGAVEKVCQPLPLESPLQETMHVGVFPFHSDENSGYLVLATTLSGELREEAFKNIGQSFTELFQAENIKGALESGFWINVPEVNFQNWCGRKAKFSFMANHRGCEVGVAFFATEKSIPQITESKEDEMLSLTVDSISTRHPVNFKAFLKLERNEKYYLYLRNGRQLQPEQKKRLVKSQIADLYMKPIDRENIRSFLASVFLCDTMAEDDSGEDAA